MTELMHTQVSEVVSTAMHQQCGAADPEIVIAVVRGLLGAGLVRPADWGPQEAFMYLAELDHGELHRAMHETLARIRAADASTVTE